jgi:hypothetical protein
VKKFDILIMLKSTILWVLAVWAIFTLLPIQDMYRDLNAVSTRRFCAYGHVYVEFERAGKIWGTTFLDDRGKPVNCESEEAVHEATTQPI